MLHPFIRNRKYLFSFGVLWLVIILVHSLFLHYHQQLDLQQSIVDALVFNGFMSFFSFSIWYVLRFKLKDKQEIPELLLNHLLLLVFTIAIWLFATYNTMLALYGTNSSYKAFLDASLVWRILIGFFFYLISVLIYYIMLYYEDLQEKLLTEAKLNELVREAELNALKAQINPHFLFNSLNSISSLTITNPEQAQEMIIKLSDFMRYSLSYERSEFTSLGSELENAKRYLDIEKIRYGKRLNYSFETSDDCMEVELPNMILQPIMENAIKHGVSQSSEEVRIQLQCQLEEQHALLRICNNFDPEVKAKAGTGIGLKNIRNRLQLLYKRNDLIRTTQTETEFEVILRIPLET